MIPTIKESTHVTRLNFPEIDDIFTNTVMDNIKIKTAIVKVLSSNYFSTIFVTNNKKAEDISEQYIFKRNIPTNQLINLRKN